MSSIYLKHLHKSIGDVVHELNTVAIALSWLETTYDENIPSILFDEGLRISWQSKEISFSVSNSRNYVNRSSIIYAVESFIWYITAISNDEFWPLKVFNEHEKSEDGKGMPDSELISDFLRIVPTTKDNDDLINLIALLCEWRNKIAHFRPQSKLKTGDKGYIKNLLKNKDRIGERIKHGFKVEIAVENFNKDNLSISLKDVTTLITMALQGAERIDEFYIQSCIKTESAEAAKILLNNILSDSDFFKVRNKNASISLKRRKLENWIKTNKPHFCNDQLDNILDIIVKQV